MDRLRNVIDHGAEMLADLETRTKEQTGIKNMKVGYNKVFGYYIEVAKSQTDLVPETGSASRPPSTPSGTSARS